MPEIILASTSLYRKELLQRVLSQFRSVDPGVDETREANEAPRDLAIRLAREKAQAVQQKFPEAIIIGSDQVAYLGDKVFGKPLTHANAVEQLTQLSGHTLHFFTAVCVINPADGALHEFVDLCEVEYLNLSPEMIANYLAREQALNCSAGLRSEGLGVSLLASMTSSDPSGLAGLPLIQLCGVLRKIGVEIL